MGKVVIFDEKSTPQKVISVIPFFKEQDYGSRTDVAVKPDLSQLEEIDSKYWKHDKGAIVEMTAQEKSAVDEAEKIIQDNIKRANLKDLMDGKKKDGGMFKLIREIMLEEINLIRQEQALPLRTIDDINNSSKQIIDSGKAD